MTIRNLLQTSFFVVLLHEIGHAIGLSHSDVENAIMFPWYQQTIKYLDEDDKMALEALYGRRKNSRTTYLTTKSSGTTQSTVTKSPEVKNLCDVLNPEVIFLAYTPEFSNYYLYVIHNNLLWKVNINDVLIPRPEKLSNYLPNEMKSIAHMFQNTGNNLFVYSSGRVFIASFPNLNIQKNLEIDLVKNNINAVFQIYSRKTFIWYTNTSFMENNENDQYRINNKGYVLFSRENLLQVQ